jgi:hypothetical protein
MNNKRKRKRKKKKKKEVRACLWVQLTEGLLCEPYNLLHL